MSKIITVSRQELYNQVWSKPLIHLAKEYQLSDVGLAKICKRHDIPLPPVGYWAKLAHGHKVEKISLTDLKNIKTEQIEIIIKEASALSISNQQENKDDLIDKALGRKIVALSEFSKKDHPLIVETQKKYRERLRSYKTSIPEGERLCVHNISVTKSSFDRAVALMNMLFQSFEANGFSIKQTAGYKGQTLVTIMGVEIQVDLKERTKRADNPDPKAYSKFLFLPTGILYLELVNIYTDNIKKIWSDTPLTKLEEIIDDIISGIVIAAIFKKKRDQEIEVKRKRDEEIRRLEQIQKEQEQFEQERADGLLEDSQLWNNSNILRAYIDAVEKKYLTNKTTGEREKKIKEWIKWGRETADKLDPLNNEFEVFDERDRESQLDDLE